MNTNNILWMGDIFPNMTESFILNSFNKYEIKPTGVKLIRDKKTNQIKNYCFVSFPNMETANDALIKLNGKRIIGTNNQFKLNWANYHKNTNKSIYVGNLNPEINDIELYNFFKQKYDNVHNANIVCDNGNSKGYGFVLFTNENEYNKCLNEMNGTIFHGYPIKVKEQKKKDENEINSNNNSFSTVAQSLSSSNSSLSLLENINCGNFYPKNKNFEINNSNNTSNNNKNMNSNNNYYNYNKNNNFSLNDNNLESLDKLDQETLYQKIRNAIKKMKEHYCYYYIGDRSKLKCK